MQNTGIVWECYFSATQAAPRRKDNYSQVFVVCWQLFFFSETLMRVFNTKLWRACHLKPTETNHSIRPPLRLCVWEERKESVQKRLGRACITVFAFSRGPPAFPVEKLWCVYSMFNYKLATQTDFIISTSGSRNSVFVWENLSAYKTKGISFAILYMNTKLQTVRRIMSSHCLQYQFGHAYSFIWIGDFDWCCTYRRWFASDALSLLDAAMV